MIKKVEELFKVDHFYCDEAQPQQPRGPSSVGVSNFVEVPRMGPRIFWTVTVSLETTIH